MRNPVAIPAVLGLLATLSLAGCGLLPKPNATPINQYQIAPNVASRGMPAASCGLVLRIGNVTANTPWATSDMLYTETAHSIKSFAYNRWAAAPAIMLTDALVEALSAAGLYRGVLGPVNPGDSDLTLVVTLRRGPLQSFSGETGKGKNNASSSRELLALAAWLTETDSGKLVASREFSAARAAAPNPYGGVIAANALAGQLIGRMLDWLRQTNATLRTCSGK